MQHRPPRMMTLTAGFTVLLTLAACRSVNPVPDLSGLYNKVARYHDQHRNPIIVIPGLLGTKLTDPASGRTVWGAFGGDAVSPRGEDGARLVALPMAEGVPLADLTDEIEKGGVLEKIEVKLMGLPLELQAYFQILGALGSGGYLDEAFHRGRIDYGKDHFTCFQFDYDWRRDNVENARKLAEFIREKSAYVAEERQKRWGTSGESVKFDIIAHSMGGPLLRYYLRYGDADLAAEGSVPELTWAGAEHVERTILVAPPNAGAVDALIQLVNGRQFGPLTPRYEPAVIGTFPSLYQLLPRPRHGVFVGGADILDPDVWEENGWGLLDPRQDRILAMLLPEVDDPATRRRIARDHLEKSLARARQFQAALDRPAVPPEGLTLHLVAGDAVPTGRVAAYRDGRVEIVAEAPGDGTVLRASALMDERLDGEWQPELRSPIVWKDVNFLFTDHLGITRDPAFTDNVLYLLLEAPR